MLDFGRTGLQIELQRGLENLFQETDEPEEIEAVAKPQCRLYFEPFAARLKSCRVTRQTHSEAPNLTHGTDEGHQLPSLVLIFDRLKAEAIRILRIIHASRDVQAILGEG